MPSRPGSHWEFGRELAAKEGDVSRVASVASFFLSRINSAADAKIAALKDADPALVEKAKHKIAIHLLRDDPKILRVSDAKIIGDPI